MTTVETTPTLVTLPIEAIRPYERNPRIISQDAVDKVRVSIEKYGYQAPIIVDTEQVVVVGHTRLQALKALGYTEVAVIITDLPADKVAEYRVIDNRAGELATWDEALLIPELRAFADQTHLSMFFPQIDLVERFAEDFKQIDDDAIAAAQELLDSRLKDSRDLKIREVTCPNCGRTFTVSG
jgi:ParB/Sulfiredoxin domain